jgi:hypothetical protein
LRSDRRARRLDLVGDVELTLDDPLRIGEEWPLSADRRAELLGDLGMPPSDARVIEQLVVRERAGSTRLADARLAADDQDALWPPRTFSNSPSGAWRSPAAQTRG